MVPRSRFRLEGVSDFRFHCGELMEIVATIIWRGKRRTGALA